MANTALNRTVVSLLTNKSGGDLAYGAVVALDNTNDKGFTTTTTSGLATRQLGVIIEPNGIANNATGLVAVEGWIPKVTLNTAATAGQFIKTHTVAGQATPFSAPIVQGTFGVALQASATPEAVLWGNVTPLGFNDISSSAQGDVIYHNGTTWTRLAAGTSGYFLKTQGAAANPMWDSAGAASGGLVLVEKKTITASAQDYTFSSLDGDTHGLYLLICSIQHGNAGTSLFDIRPNAATTNLIGTRYYSTGSGVANTTLTTLNIGFAVGTTEELFSRTLIYARKVANSVARNRYFITEFNRFASGGNLDTGFIAGRWNETATNLTSLVVRGDQTTSLGNGSELFLYRYAQS